MTAPTSSERSPSWRATLRLVRDAVGDDDIERARGLLHDACHPGRLRYRLPERLAGIPRLVTTTMEAINAAFTVDAPYAQAARTFVRSGLELLPGEPPRTWSQLRAVRLQLSVARSMARLVPAKAREDAAVEEAFAAAFQALDEAGEQAARLRATLSETRLAVAAMRAVADDLNELVGRMAAETDRSHSAPPDSP